MGLAQGGANSGAAQGSITINTSQLAAARAAVNSFATGVNTTLTGINPAIVKTEASFGGLTGAANQLASAFGLSLSIGGAVQLGKMAVAASETATAYNRQAVAARTLAGSQDQLNARLAIYDKATGGVVDKATALTNVTKLMAVGFADTGIELEKFATVIRGISIAMGQSQDMVTQNLILELFTQRGARLDQLGLQYDKVKQRADELQASDSSLTAKIAYQNAVLEQATERFGKLGKSAEGQATGIEKAKKSSADFGLVVGQILGPTINAVGADFSRTLDRWQAGLQAAINLTKDLAQAVHLIAPDVSATIGSRTGIGSNMRQSPKSMDRSPLEGERQVHLDWAQGITDLNQQVHTDIIDEEKSFGASRAKTVADYSKSVARDEANYARGRLRANLDFLDSMADVAKDAARREAGAAADLARTMGSARDDGAARVADIRKESAKRLADIEESYAEDREKAARQHTDNLRDAARDLNAKAVADEQHKFAEQEDDAKKAHDKAVKDNNEQLKERLDDEAKSLAKSLKQQQDAYDRQLIEGRENDRLRLQDMKDAFAKQQERAAEDHAEQVKERAEDQAAQLAEMDTQHNLRLEQIANHAAADRLELDAQAKTDLLALGVRNAAWKKAAEDKEKAQEKLWDKFMEHVNGTLKEGRPNTPQIAPAGFASGGFVPHDMIARVHRGEYVMPARQVTTMMGGSRSLSFGNITVNVAGTNASAGDIANAVDQRIKQHMEGWAA